MVDEAGGRDDDVLAEMVPQKGTDGTDQLHLQRVCVEVTIHRTVLIYGLQLTCTNHIHISNTVALIMCLIITWIRL